MKKNYLVAGVIIILAVGAFMVIQQRKLGSGGVACTMDAKICPDGSAVGRQGPNCEFAACPEDGACDEGVCVRGSNQEVRLTLPKEGDAIGLPLRMQGKARVAENIFGYRLMNANNILLLQGFITVENSEPGTLGSFDVDVNYGDPRTGSGTLEIVLFDEVSGVEVEKETIPLVFAPVNAADINVYFSNKVKDPGVMECEKTYPVKRRIAQSDEMSAEAVRELLRGPSALEGDLGFLTALSPTTRLNSIEVRAGVAYADFSEELQRGVAGSCRIGAIRSQIENTIKQFKGINEVVISINGQSEGILQP